MRASFPVAAAAAAIALAASGCVGHDNAMLSETDGGALDFTIGGRAFHVSSGGGRMSGGVLGLFLTDQPDTCLATSQVPIGSEIVFTLRVAPRADGTTAATVGPNKPTPAAGEAVGGITWQTGGVVDVTWPANDGAVSWTANSDGSYTITQLDAGFDGASGRVTLGGWKIPACN